MPRHRSPQSLKRDEADEDVRKAAIEAEERVVEAALDVIRSRKRKIR